MLFYWRSALFIFYYTWLLYYKKRKHFESLHIREERAPHQTQKHFLSNFFSTSLVSTTQAARVCGQFNCIGLWNLPTSKAPRGTLDLGSTVPVRKKNRTREKTFSSLNWAWRVEVGCQRTQQCVIIWFFFAQILFCFVAVVLVFFYIYLSSTLLFFT